MRELRDVAGAFALRLEDIHQKTMDVDKIVDAVERVSEQTDLLAVNAAIEAEKAGQHGAGFAVVAREVRRLSDQTAVASEGIGASVREMHAAVSAGIMSMDKFADKVRRGAEEIERVAQEFPQLFDDVRTLAERMELLEQNAVSYFRRARRVTETAATLAGQVERSTARLQSVGGVTREVQLKVSGIYDLVDGIEIEE
ncbi:MAG: methyl-accepting chemotaxis protein [Planctomycetota bacterium]